MNGIVSLLDAKYQDKVKGIWQRLESGCGLKSVQNTPYPHFSWQIAEDYNWEEVERSLSYITAQTMPFQILTAGLGIFSGINPVLYIPVVRDGNLSRLHDLVWEHLLPLSGEPPLYYSPQAWIPHITLAYLDVTTEKLNCALNLLVAETFNWVIKIDHLAIVTQAENQTVEVRQRFAFQAET